VFFTGTASEVTPIRLIDQVRIGSGHRGLVARALLERYCGIIEGSVPDRHGWL